MKLTVLKGSYRKEDLEDLITKMIHIKIRFHEDKINSSAGEEEIKLREKRIIELQKDLYNLKKFVKSIDEELINADAEIQISLSPVKTVRKAEAI